MSESLNKISRTGNYELVYLLSPLLENSDLDVAVNKVRGFINVLNGEIKKENMPEKKKLSYPIKKQLYGHFVANEFQLEPEKIAELDKQLKSESDILRFLIVGQEKHKEKKVRTRITKSKKPAAATFATPAAKTETKPERIKIEELDKKLEELLK